MKILKEMSHSTHIALKVISLILVCVSCKIEKDYFGESAEANVVQFEIEDQISSIIEPFKDTRDTGFIDVVVPSSKSLDDLKVRMFTMSQLAHSPIKLYDSTNFVNTIVFTVFAEDSGYKKTWKLSVKKEDDSGGGTPDSNPQVAFSNMKQWTNMLNAKGEKTYIKSLNEFGYTPGDGFRNIWSTTAEANSSSASGIEYFTTRPEPNHSTPVYARMETIKGSFATLLAKSGVVTGALFTGKFIFNLALGLNPNNARKMLDFGTLFSDKPKQVKLKYRYSPGEQMIDGLQKVIPANSTDKATQDSCEMYFILHNRDGDTWQRVGAAWLRSPNKVGDPNDDNTFKEETLDFVYGKPSAEMLKEKPYMKIGGTIGEVTFYTFTNNGGTFTPSASPVSEIYATDPENTIVTHITIMLSSSAYGDKFWAAINEYSGAVGAGELRGSTLDVQDIEFVY